LRSPQRAHWACVNPSDQLLTRPTLHAHSTPRQDTDVPQPTPGPGFASKRHVPTALRGAAPGGEWDDDTAFAWEADLELVAGEVDHHANALKGAVLVSGGQHWRVAPCRKACGELYFDFWSPVHCAAQGRLLALKAKLTHQVGLLDSERRFINARAAALQSKADQLQARRRQDSPPRRRRLTSSCCGTGSPVPRTRVVRQDAAPRPLVRFPLLSDRSVSPGA
jgi:hypothetical protein